MSGAVHVHTLCSQGLQIFFLSQGFSFCCSSLLSHTCKSMPRSSLSPISSLLNELHAPAHLSSIVEQFRYSEEFTSWEARALFHYCYRREEAVHKHFQKNHLDLCLQVVTTVCSFDILPRFLKGWKGRRGTQNSPRLLFPLSGNCAGIPKRLKNRQVKLGYSKSY